MKIKKTEIKKLNEAIKGWIKLTEGTYPDDNDFIDAFDNAITELEEPFRFTLKNEYKDVPEIFNKYVRFYCTINYFYEGEDYPIFDRDERAKIISDIVSDLDKINERLSGYKIVVDDAGLNAAVDGLENSIVNDKYEYRKKKYGKNSKECYIEVPYKLLKL